MTQVPITGMPICNLTTPHSWPVADLKKSVSWVRGPLRRGRRAGQPRSEGAERASSAGSPESEQIRDAHGETHEEHVARRGYTDEPLREAADPVRKLTVSAAPLAVD